MIVSPLVQRLARGVAVGAVGLAVPFDKILLGVMLIAQLRSMWLQEEKDEEARAGGGDDSGSGGDRLGRLDTPPSVNPPGR